MSFRALDILALLWNRLVLLKDKVKQATRDFSIHPIHARRKRSLLNLVGSASNFLFGTATEDEVQDVLEHYNKLIISAAQNKLGCKA